MNKHIALIAALLVLAGCKGECPADKIQYKPIGTTLGYEISSTYYPIKGAQKLEDKPQGVWR